MKTYVIKDFEHSAKTMVALRKQFEALGKAIFKMRLNFIKKP